MKDERPHWWPAYIGIGSNLDEPRRQVASAIDDLKALPKTRLIRASRFYRSPPMDASDQPDYVNAVAAMLTQLDARTLLQALKAIEKQHGRVRGGCRWAARPLDLDLLVFGDQEICNDELTVPHPGIAKRAFVLLPLCEIAPQLPIPGLSTAERQLQKLAAGSAIDAELDD